MAFVILSKSKWATQQQLTVHLHWLLISLLLGSRLERAGSCNSCMSVAIRQSTLMSFLLPHLQLLKIGSSEREREGWSGQGTQGTSLQQYLLWIRGHSYNTTGLARLGCASFINHITVCHGVCFTKSCQVHELLVTVGPKQES